MSPCLARFLTRKGASFISVETVYTFTEIACDLSASKRDTFN